MKILIADDEFLARSSLRSIIADFNLPVDLVVEAADGQEMDAMLNQYKPDVAFVDIRMPRLNGLEAIKAGKSISPQTKWYILTGFPEFDYAQEAIRLGVSSYLLKPVKPEELLTALQDALEESKKWKVAQNKQFERILLALNNGLTSIEFEEPNSFLLRASYLGAIVYIDSRLPEKAKAERQLIIVQVFHHLMDECLDNQARIAIFVLPSGELAIVGAWESAQNNNARACILHYFEAVEAEISRQDDESTSFTLLTSRECSSYKDLQVCLERLHQVASLRVLCGVHTRLDISILDKRAVQPGWLEFSRLVLELCHAFHERQYLNYMKAFESLKISLLKVKIPGKPFPISSLVEFLNCALGCNLTIHQSVEEWLPILRAYGDSLISSYLKEEGSGANIIDQVTSYINQNYMQDIGIGQIAEKFNITPNYLSTLFHKKNGTTFMGYLKSVRLLRARELLTNPDIQIQQVAEQVGYINPRHFTRLFYDYFGYLPSDYRNNFKNL